MAKGKAVIKGENKKGTVFALCAMDDGTFEVWKLAENHNGKLRGGVQKTWRYVENGLSENTARDLYRRRINGAQR